LDNFDPFFIISKKNISNNENIWNLEEVTDSPITIQNLKVSLDHESNNEYNLIELDDLENLSLIKE
jgi:hypothetical protein